MLKDAINRLLELANIETFTFDDRRYASKSLTPVKPPTIAAFTAHTLTGIKDFLVGNADGLTLKDIIVQIKDHTHVEVFSPLVKPWQDRHQHLSVSIKPKEFPFGQFMSTEELIIALQTYFKQTETTAQLMKIVGNISDDTNIKVLDDGISQEVTAKMGIARLADVQLPNPIALQPYRTFLEVEQPESLFVFRLRKGREGQTPGGALFEADGGNWQLEAIKRVRDWLRANLPQEVSTNIIA